MGEITADQIVIEAWDAFDQWVSEHDPDGEMDIIEAIDAYSEWCSTKAHKAGD